MTDVADSSFSVASRAIKLAVTLAIYYVNFANGIVVNMLSPAVVHYSRKFNTDVQNVSFVFSITLGCYVLGSLMCGVLYRYVARHPCVVLLLVILTVPVYVIPWLENITPFYVMGALIGIGVGGYDPAQVAWIIDIWRNEAGPFILGQHFAYSIGTIVPPLLVGPFLAGDEDGGTTMKPNLLIAAEEAIPTEEPYRADVLYIPFSVAGSLSALSVLFQLILLIILSVRRKSILQNPVAAGYKEVETNENDVNENDPVPSTSTAPVVQISSNHGKPKTIYLIILSCMFIGGYQGLEMCTMQFLPTFAHFSGAKLSESDASHVLTALTLAFSMGRGFGIFLILKVSAEYILIGNFLLTAAGGAVLYCMGSSLTMLWIGSILLGLGYSTTYPSYFAYIEKYLFVTDPIACMITICGGSVAFMYPIIIGQAVEENPNIMLYVGSCSLAVVVPTFATVYFITRRRRRQHSE